MNFVAGQKSPLETLTASKNVVVGVGLDFPPGTQVDISCFGVDKDGQFRHDPFPINK